MRTEKIKRMPDVFHLFCGNCDYHEIFNTDNEQQVKEYVNQYEFPICKQTHKPHEMSYKR